MQVTLLASGFAVACLISLLLLSGVFPVGKRWVVWAGVALSAIATIAIWDAIELRVDSGMSYVRSDWDWENGGGGFQEWIAFAALFIGPWVTASLTYCGLAMEASTRLRDRRWRTVAYVALVPLVMLLAFGLFVAVIVHPWLFWPDRTS